MVWTVKVEGRRTWEYRVKRWQKGGHDRLYVDLLLGRGRLESQGYYDVVAGQMVWQKRGSNPDLNVKLVAKLEKLAREIRAEAAALADPDVC